MIATLLALALTTSPPESPDRPKPPPSATAGVRPDATATARKAEADRKKVIRARMRALNSRRLAGLDDPGTAPSVGTARGFGGGTPGGMSRVSGGSGVPASPGMGSGVTGDSGFGGGFGGGSFDPGQAGSFDQMLAATYAKAESAMAQGAAAVEASASLT